MRNAQLEWAAFAPVATQPLLATLLVLWVGSSALAGQDPSAPVDRGDYVLQIGDEIEIRVFELPELETRAQIRPDGKISMVLLDDMQAAGLTPLQLDAALTNGYSTYYFNPRVTVIVRSFSNQKVFVGGEVSRPGMQPLAGDLSALGAILQAGGFQNTASRSSVILLRKGENGPVVVRLNLDEIIEKGSSDPVLQPFDVVYVPQKFIAKANLFVQQYIRDLLPIATNANFTYILGSNVAVVP